MGKRSLDVVGTTGVCSPQPKKARKAMEEAASGAAAIDQLTPDKVVMEAAPAAAAEVQLKPEVRKVLDNDSEKAAHDTHVSQGSSSARILLDRCLPAARALNKMVRYLNEAEQRLVRGLSPLERITRSSISKASDWEDMPGAITSNETGLVFEPDEGMCKRRRSHLEAKSLKLGRKRREYS